MYIQVVYLEVQPEKVNEFIIEALANVNTSRKETGVKQFELIQRVDNPFKFMLYEVYLSQEAAEAHRQTPHFKRWLEAGIPLLTGDRIREIYREIEGS